VASGGNAVATGLNARATGAGAIAFGVNAIGSSGDSLAFGFGANASGQGGTSVGATTRASGTNSTAIGNAAAALHANSTAVGAGAATTRANQVVLGTASTSITLPGLLTTSDAAQAGQEFFVTVDNNGTLGKGAQSSAALSQLGSQVQSLQSGQALIDDNVAALQTGQVALGRGLRQANGGIAAAMAMGGTMIVPDSNISLNFNLATYRGQQGFSGAVAARVTPKVYISGGFAGSTVKGSTGARVGVAFGF
jgi:trimeric autotransporter adhesin